MPRPMKRVLAILAAVVIAGAAMIAAACGDGRPAVSQHDQPARATAATGGASLSSIAPNTFLTYEGKRYRLADVEQADLVGQDSFLRVGIASEANIDQDDLTVFKRKGVDGAIYTYARENRQNDAAGAVEGTEATTPALWYRWVAD